MADFALFLHPGVLLFGSQREAPDDGIVFLFTGDTRNIRQYPKLWVYPKYRVVPETLGLPEILGSTRNFGFTQNIG